MKIQKLRHGHLFFTTSLLITLVMLTAGCSGEGEAWEKAQTENNTWSYRVYLKDYPRSTHSVEAYFRIAELSNNIQDYRIVLRQSNNKKNPFYEKARKRIEELSYKRVEEEGTLFAYENFIKIIQKGPSPNRQKKKYSN